MYSEGTPRARARRRRRGIIPYALELEELESVLLLAEPNTLAPLREDARLDAIDRALGRPNLDAHTALERIVEGRALGDEHPRLYLALLEHIAMFAGRMLPHEALAPLPSGVSTPLDRLLFELDAPLSVEDLLDGEAFLPIPLQEGRSRTSWFDVARCEELDAFFAAQDMDELRDVLDWQLSDEGIDPEDVLAIWRDLEEGFALVAEEGSGIATFYR